MKRSISVTRVAVRIAALVLLAGAAPASLAVPSFARQTGMACEACHTVWPELTHFGRVFKANGYTLDNLKQVRGVNVQKEELLDLAQTPPLSIMVQVSETSLAKAMPDASGTGSAQNGTVGFPQQLSLFYAGKIAPHLGAFVQFTYSSADGSFGIDNTDIRFADLKVLDDGGSFIYGLSLNNNPTVQDLWNSTPAFGFPYAASDVAPGAPTSAQIDGARGQDVAGLTAYAFLNESWYGELGVYRSAKQGYGGQLDSTTPGGVIDGYTPYYRLAYEHNSGRHSIELGVYGANFKVFPDAGNGYGKPLSGPSDRYQDFAVDFQYQYYGDRDLVSVMATHIHENQTLDASGPCAACLGLASNASDSLSTTRITATYYYQRRFGGSLGAFSTTGSADAGLYAGAPSVSNTPDTRGYILELNYLPWLNTKFSLQYTAFSKFNGSSSNYDGNGRNASDNNTLYLLAWLSY
jgi:hypothetical protein